MSDAKRKEKVREKKKRAERLPESEILFQRGINHYNGDGEPQDYKKAARFFNISAELGNPKANTQLGHMYRKGLGVKKDIQKTLELYKRASEQGEYLASADLATIYRDGEGLDPNPERYRHFLQIAADQGHDDSQCELAGIYENGHGVEKDLKKAVPLYKLAAEQGHTAALNNLSLLYQYGTGVEKNLKVAVRLLKLAVIKKFVPAMYNFALLFIEGEAAPKNLQSAVLLLEHCVKENLPMAFFKLGSIYERDDFEGRDLIKARDYYYQAKQRGVGIASERIMAINMKLQPISNEKNAEEKAIQNNISGVKAYKEKDFVIAAHHFEQALHYWKTRPEAYAEQQTAAYNLGKAQFNTKQYKEALPNLKFAKDCQGKPHCSKDPKYSEYYKQCKLELDQSKQQQRTFTKPTDEKSTSGAGTFPFFEPSTRASSSSPSTSPATGLSSSSSSSSSMASDSTSTSSLTLSRSFED